MCLKKCGCLIGIFLGIILGIIVGYISFATLIPGIIISTWIGFGIAAFAIIALIILSLFSNRRTSKCICCYGKCLLGGAIGTIISAIILLSITIVIGSIATSILIGFGVFFLTITIATLTRLICCLIRSTCECRE